MVITFLYGKSLGSYTIIPEARGVSSVLAWSVISETSGSQCDLVSHSLIHFLSLIELTCCCACVSPLCLSTDSELDRGNKQYLIPPSWWFSVWPIAVSFSLLPSLYIPGRQGRSFSFLHLQCLSHYLAQWISSVNGWIDENLIPHMWLVIYLRIAWINEWMTRICILSITSSDSLTQVAYSLSNLNLRILLQACSWRMLAALPQCFDFPMLMTLKFVQGAAELFNPISQSQMIC